MSNALTSDSQITLPEPVRERLGVGPGDSVDFRVNDHGEVVIERTRVAEEPSPNPFARWRGVWKGRMTTDEIMAMSRGEVD